MNNVDEYFIKYIWKTTVTQDKSIKREFPRAKDILYPTLRSSWCVSASQKVRSRACFPNLFDITDIVFLYNNYETR